MKITKNVAFEFWHFSPIFVLLKVACQVTLFDRKLQVLKNSPKWTLFVHFTLNVNENISLRSKCCKNETFSQDFPTLCSASKTKMACQRKTLEKWLLLQFRIKILSHLTIVSLWHNRCTGSPKTHWGDQRFMHATMARSSSSSFQSHIESARQPYFLSPQCLKITQKVSFNIASEASYVYLNET